MRDTDVDAFKEILEATMSMYNREIPIATRRIWWAALAAYELSVVRRALAHHVTGSKGKFAPLPADILDLIRGESGHLSADEAWALALESLDECNTVVWTQEIASAFLAARACLDLKDKFGARAAFVSAYERGVRQSNPEPVWLVSVGHDAGRRAIALQSAIESGRIKHESAEHLLPPPPENKVVTGLLMGATDVKGLDPRWAELSKNLQVAHKAAEEKRETDRLARDAEFKARREQAIYALGVVNG